MKYIQNIEDEAEAIKQKYDVLYYIKPLGSINLITAPRYTAVDLGLPSGRLWANMNIGAEKETDYGLYFQWGDTIGYNDASHATWATCPGNGGNSAYTADLIAAWDAENLQSVTGMAYSTKILKPTVDAATVNMGSKWRMPTEEDCLELRRNTNIELAVIDGVKGRKFTSTADTSQYIFLPLAGTAINNGHFDGLGVSGGIWSSSVNPNSPEKASCLWVADEYGGQGPANTASNYRYYAHSVRGVC